MNETDADGSLTRIGFIPHIPSADPHNWLGTFGASVWNGETGEVTLDAPEPLALLEWYDTYAKEYGIENIAAFRTTCGGNGFGHNSPDGLYYTGQIATRQISSWLYNDVGEYGPDLNFGVTKVPSPSTAANGQPGKLQANLFFAQLTFIEGVSFTGVKGGAPAETPLFPRLRRPVKTCRPAPTAGCGGRVPRGQEENGSKSVEWPGPQSPDVRGWARSP